MNRKKNFNLHRRQFLGAISTAAIGASMLTTPLSLAAKEKKLFMPGLPDDWFDKIKGKHRIVFDATEPLDLPVLPFAWPRIFLMSSKATGTTEKDCSVVMVLRHNDIPYALEDQLWEKYKLGEMFKINDPATGSPALHNPFWQPKLGTYKVPGVGEVSIGINELQDSGVLFCACDVAITVNSAAIAQKMNADAAEIKKEWESGVLPGIHIVPSGVWAINRAQEHGCSYCKAG